MLQTMDNLWDGIESAQIFERGRYFEPNFAGVVVVTRTLAKATRASGIAFIVEMEVEETNMPDKHPIGSKGTWFQKLIDPNVAFPAIAAWAAACNGYGVHQKEQIKEEVLPILKELMKEATGRPDDNAFIGSKLRLQTTQVKTKKDTDFTRYDFSPAE